MEADVRLGSQYYYGFFRKCNTGATCSSEERLNNLRMICEGGSLNMAFLTNVMKNPLEQNRMLRLADLFENHVNDYQMAMMITNVIRESLERREEALTMYKKSLDIRLKVLGPDRADTAASLNNIANVLCDQVKLEEALTMHQGAGHSIV